MLNPQLRTFLCVAESGSFSKAAEQLYLSSTAVIKQINALERALGLTLLQRSHHGVSLTPAGRIIQRYGQNMEGPSGPRCRRPAPCRRRSRRAFGLELPC